MDAEKAIQYLHFKAEECRNAAYSTRDMDKVEALLLLLPPLMRLLNLRPMDAFDAGEFHEQLKVLVKFPPTTHAGPERVSGPALNGK